MEKQFALEILSQENKIFEGKIVSLVVPAKLGFLGVLANHAPLICTLTNGKITLREASGESKTFVVNTNGLLRVFNNQATILLESA